MKHVWYSNEMAEALPPRVGPEYPLVPASLSHSALILDVFNFEEIKAGQVENTGLST